MTEPSPPWRLIESADVPASSPSERAAPAPAVQGPDSTLVRTIALLALAGLLAAGAFVLAVSGGDGSGVVVDGSAAPFEPGATAPSDEAGQTDVVVEVAGAVREPGMFRVPPGTRVGDLIALAGGYGPRVDVARVDAEINLAAVLADGERIRIPSRDDAAGPPAAPANEPSPGDDSGRIDLNTASLEQLDTLPGVGPVTAEKILAAREEAPFTAVEELRSRGILGEKTFEEVRPLVTVP